MRFKFRRSVVLAFIIFLLAAAYVLFQKCSKNEMHWFLCVFLMSGGLYALFLIMTFTVKVGDVAFEGNYLFQGKTLKGFVCKYEDIRFLDYGTTTYLVSQVGIPNPIMVSILIEDYKEILKAILKKCPNIQITSGARKKMVRDKVLSFN